MAERHTVDGEVVGGVAPELDHIDRRILKLLAADARLSVRAIAREVQMSPSAIAERLSRMEEHRVILGYHARIDPTALGYRLEAIVGLQTRQGPALEQTLEGLLAIPEVEEVSVVTGDWDLVVRVRVRDHQHLRAVVLDAIWPMPAFRHSQTMIVYETRERPREDPGWGRER